MDDADIEAGSCPNVLDWLALSLLPRLGARRLKQWQEERAIWPQGWLSQLSDAQRHYFHYLRHSQGHQQVIQPLLAWCKAAPGRVLLHPNHPKWPSLLAELTDPPPVLWAWGNLDSLSMPVVAIVGSRHPSDVGRRYAHHFARALAAAGSCIVSGMALGIDAQAHEGALAASGATVAVLGSGLDCPYPRQHRDLMRRIIGGGGLVLSEHPPTTNARAAFFPRRNRIITGMSKGVIVVEAAMRSGSLISARLALEQNRDVFALPGAPDAPASEGCHQLIRQGATLVTRPEHVMEELGGPWTTDPLVGKTISADDVPVSCRATKAALQTSNDACFLALLRQGPLSLDQLVLRSGYSLSDTLNTMLMLELAGKVVLLGNGWGLSTPSSESRGQTR